MVTGRFNLKGRPARVRPGCGRDLKCWNKVFNYTHTRTVPCRWGGGEPGAQKGQAVHGFSGIASGQKGRDTLTLCNEERARPQRTLGRSISLGLTRSPYLRGENASKQACLIGTGAHFLATLCRLRIVANVGLSRCMSLAGPMIGRGNRTWHAWTGY